MKFLHKLLVFALLFVGVITQALAESFTVNGVVYRITNTGVAVNNLAADNNLNGIVYVPEEVQYGSTTYKVTGIDYLGNKDIKEISLPGTIKKIADRTFMNCNNLQTVKLGEGISYVSEEMFYNCTALKYVSLPNSLQNIGRLAFEFCSKLEHLVIPSTVDSIGENAFYSCSALQQINIPQGIKSLANEVLAHTGIKTLDIPSSVNYIGEKAFRNCESLQSIKLPEGLTLLNDELFDGCKQLSDIQIPSTVTTIKKAAFNDCKALKTITLPASLNTFEIPSNNDISIFSGCSALKSILVEANNKYFESDGTALYNKAKDTLICFPGGVTSFVVPQSVKTIGVKAFCNCDSLQNIMFEDGVSDLVIGEYAFKYCKNINKLVITSGIKEAKYEAFYKAHIKKLVITTTHPKSFYEYYLLKDNSIETIYAPVSDLSIIRKLTSSTLIPLNAIYVPSDITIGSRSIVFKLIKNEELSGLDDLPTHTLALKLVIQKLKQMRTDATCTQDSIPDKHLHLPSLPKTVWGIWWVAHIHLQRELPTISNHLRSTLVRHTLQVLTLDSM